MPCGTDEIIENPKKAMPEAKRLKSGRLAILSEDGYE